MGHPRLQKRSLRFFLKFIEILLIALALSWILRTYIIEDRVITSDSMLQTIQIGDGVMVDKIFFNHLDHIKSGDVIVFIPPPNTHENVDFIKRLIGLPGDKVEIRNHITYVNDKQLDESYVSDPSSRDFGPVVVPNDSVFVLGDNRNHSYDSTIWGFLPIKNIKGRALFRYWPLTRIGALTR